MPDNKEEDFEELEQVLFQGPLYGRETNLKKNPRLVQAGLIPVKRMITDALSRRAHTMTFEPASGQIVVRMVVDGIPYPAGALPGKRGVAMIQMVKLLAGLDTQNRLEFQSGGIQAEYYDAQYRLLVDTTPVRNAAEKLRIRIEDVKESFVRPSEIGFPDDLKKKIQAVTDDATGVLLACGPAESGITSLSIVATHCMDPYLYSVYNIADVGHRELINVTEFESEEGFDLELSLDKIIRQEGDAVYAGRFDDPQQAQLLFQFSDRLCFFGEIAAKNPFEAVRRLIHLVGLDQVLRGLKGIITHKLVRRLCNDCKQAYRPSQQLLKGLGLPRETTVLYRPPTPPQNDDPEASSIEEMCAPCNGVPYYGRTATYEFLEMTDEMKEVVAAGADPATMKKQMIIQKQRVLQRDALRLVVAGTTSLDELQRVFSSPRRKGRLQRQRNPQ